MNIINAAGAMHIGKKIKLPHWDFALYSNSHGIFRDDDNSIYEYWNSDLLLSDNFEVVEEKSLMEKAWKELCKDNPVIGEHDFVHKQIFEKTWIAATKHFTEK